MVQGRITEVDTTTVQLGATPSELFRPYPTIFTPDALSAATLPIYPGLGQAQEYAGLHTAMAWFPVAWLTATIIVNHYLPVKEFRKSVSIWRSYFLARL